MTDVLTRESVTWTDVTWDGVDWGADEDTPEVSALGWRVYRALGPGMTGLDADNGYAHLDVCAVISEPLVEPDSLGRDFGQVWDVDSRQGGQLDHAAQYVGVTRPPTYDDEQMRTLIRERPAYQRGSPEAIVSAVRARLAGSRRVELTERDGGDVNALRIRIYLSEIVSLADVQQAVLEQKPAGIVATVEPFPGQDWQDVVNAHATWQDVIDAHPTWQDLIDTLPPQE